jgi:hypothetical protein
MSSTYAIKVSNYISFKGTWKEARPLTESGNEMNPITYFLWKKDFQEWSYFMSECFLIKDLDLVTLSVEIKSRISQRFLKFIWMR